MKYRFYAVLLLLVSGASIAAEPSTLIINATLISAERSAPLRDAWVRIDAGVISGVGSGPVDAEAAMVLDAQGQFLIPGLIDSHVHLYHATGLKRRYAEDFASLYEEYMEQQPRSFLYFGFTTVVELNADSETNERFDAAPVHPNVVHCSQGIALSDGFMALELEGEPIDTTYPGFLVDHHADGHLPTGTDASRHTPQAAVDHVRQNGGRCIKLYYEEALWWPGGAPEFRLPSRAIVRDVVAAAHERKLPVVLHATTPNGHAFALDTGIDVLAHGMWEWPDQAFDAGEPMADYAEIAGRVADSGLGLQPTISTIRNTYSLFQPDVLLDPNWQHVVPAAYLDYLRGDGQRQRDDFLARFGASFGTKDSLLALPKLMTAFNQRYERLIGNMSAQGANLLFGTDTAVGGFGWAAPPGLAGYWEMQAWIRAGVSLETLFRSLTIDNARAFRLDHEIGTIEVGKRADLLLLQANPLTDVAAYDTLDQIIIGGRVMDRESLSAH